LNKKREKEEKEKEREGVRGGEQRAASEKNHGQFDFLGQKF
jgi:hypothetical protein